MRVMPLAFRTQAMVCLLALVVAAVGCTSSPPAAPPKAQEAKPAAAPQAATPTYKWRFASLVSAEAAIGKGFLKFAELAGKKSGGRINIETFLSGTLASEQAAIQGVLNGTIEMGTASTQNMGGFTKAYYPFDLPYLVTSIDDFMSLTRADVGKELGAQLKKDAGLKALMYGDAGGSPRIVYNTKKRVQVPTDLKGLKIRTTNTPVELGVFKAWGANAVPMPFGELYVALQQGTVDGNHSAYFWMMQGRHEEIVKYASETNDTLGALVVVMSLKLWNQLPADLQQALVAAAREAEDYTAPLTKEEAKGAKQMAISKGVVEGYTLTADEMKLWQDAGKATWDQFFQDGSISKDMVRRIQEAVKK